MDKSRKRRYKNNSLNAFEKEDGKSEN